MRSVVSEFRRSGLEEALFKDVSLTKSFITSRFKTQIPSKSAKGCYSLNNVFILNMQFLCNDSFMCNSERFICL